MLANEQIFPGHGEEKGDKYRLTVFLRTFLGEIPKENLLKLTERYNLSELGRQMIANLWSSEK